MTTEQNKQFNNKMFDLTKWGLANDMFIIGPDHLLGEPAKINMGLTDNLFAIGPNHLLEEPAKIKWTHEKGEGELTIWNENWVSREPAKIKWTPEKKK